MLLVLAAALALFSLSAYADQWEFFFPEQVITFGCKASLIEASERGGSTREMWEAEAYAKRKSEGDWSMTLGVFAPDVKGRHQAEKACSQWMDEAGKRVKKAQ